MDTAGLVDDGSRNITQIVTICLMFLPLIVKRLTVIDNRRSATVHYTPTVDAGLIKAVIRRVNVALLALPTSDVTMFVERRQLHDRNGTGPGLGPGRDFAPRSPLLIAK